MSNAVSALDGAKFKGFVTVREMGLQGMITLRGDLSAAKIKKTLKEATGLAMPKTREVLHAGDKSVGWMSPDELLILCPHRQAENIVASMNKALGATHGLIVNVSDARAIFEITGADVRDTLAKLAPADLSTNFQPGQIRRSRLAQVAGAFWLVDQETAHVVCFRSVAQYMFDILSLSAQKGGEVGYF